MTHAPPIDWLLVLSHFLWILGGSLLLSVFSLAYGSGPTGAGEGKHSSPIGMYPRISGIGLFLILTGVGAVVSPLVVRMTLWAAGLAVGVRTAALKRK